MSRKSEIYNFVFEYSGMEYIPGLGQVQVSPAHASDSLDVREVLEKYLPDEGEYFSEDFELEEDF